MILINPLNIEKSFKKIIPQYRYIKKFTTIHKGTNGTNRKNLLQQLLLQDAEIQGACENIILASIFAIDFRGEGSPVLRHSYRFTRSNEAAKKLLLLVSPSAQVTPCVPLRNHRDEFPFELAAS